MTKQEKLNRIYEVIANKELSFGCKLIAGWENWKIDSETKVFLDRLTHCDDKWCESYFIYKVIGHPVMIGDYLHWLGTTKSQESNWKQLYPKALEVWNIYNKSIDEQSDECIDYIYSLIK